MFFSFCLAWYTVLASRVKSNILIIIVTIKLLHREIWRFICSLYIHEKIKYSCNPSVYQATHTGDLKTHIQSVHEKIKYSCNLCDHKATRQGHLKTHIQSAHEKIKYSCNQCDHQATGNKHCNERERGTGGPTLYYFYSSPDTIQCSPSLSLC